MKIQIPPLTFDYFLEIALIEACNSTKNPNLAGVFHVCSL